MHARAARLRIPSPTTLVAARLISGRRGRLFSTVTYEFFSAGAVRDGVSYRSGPRRAREAGGGATAARGAGWGGRERRSNGPRRTRRGGGGGGGGRGRRGGGGGETGSGSLWVAKRHSRVSARDQEGEGGGTGTREGGGEGLKGLVTDRLREGVDELVIFHRLHAAPARPAPGPSPRSKGGDPAA